MHPPCFVFSGSVQPRSPFPTSLFGRSWPPAPLACFAVSLGRHFTGATLCRLASPPSSFLCVPLLRALAAIDRHAETSMLHAPSHAYDADEMARHAALPASPPKRMRTVGPATSGGIQQQWAATGMHDAPTAMHPMPRSGSRESLASLMGISSSSGIHASHALDLPFASSSSSFASGHSPLPHHFVLPSSAGSTHASSATRRWSGGHASHMSPAGQSQFTLSPMPLSFNSMSATGSSHSRSSSPAPRPSGWTVGSGSSISGVSGNSPFGLEHGFRGQRGHTPEPIFWDEKPSHGHSSRVHTSTLALPHSSTAHELSPSPMMPRAASPSLAAATTAGLHSSHASVSHHSYLHASSYEHKSQSHTVTQWQPEPDHFIGAMHDDESVVDASLHSQPAALVARMAAAVVPTSVAAPAAAVRLPASKLAAAAAKVSAPAVTARGTPARQRRQSARAAAAASDSDDDDDSSDGNYTNHNARAAPRPATVAAAVHMQPVMATSSPAQHRVPVVARIAGRSAHAVPAVMAIQVPIPAGVEQPQQATVLTPGPSPNALKATAVSVGASVGMSPAKKSKSRSVVATASRVSARGAAKPSAAMSESFPVPAAPASSAAFAIPAAPSAGTALFDSPPLRGGQSDSPTILNASGASSPTVPARTPLKRQIEATYSRPPSSKPVQSSVALMATAVTHRPDSVTPVAAIVTSARVATPTNPQLRRSQEHPSPTLAVVVPQSHRVPPTNVPIAAAPTSNQQPPPQAHSQPHSQSHAQSHPPHPQPHPQPAHLLHPQVAAAQQHFLQSRFNSPPPLSVLDRPLHSLGNLGGSSGNLASLGIVATPPQMHMRSHSPVSPVSLLPSSSYDYPDRHETMLGAGGQSDRRSNSPPRAPHSRDRAGSGDFQSYRDGSTDAVHDDAARAAASAFLHSDLHDDTDNDQVTPLQPSRQLRPQGLNGAPLPETPRTQALSHLLSHTGLHASWEGGIGGPVRRGGLPHHPESPVGGFAPTTPPAPAIPQSQSGNRAPLYGYPPSSMFGLTQAAGASSRASPLPHSNAGSFPTAGGPSRRSLLHSSLLQLPHNSTVRMEQGLSPLFAPTKTDLNAVPGDMSLLHMELQ
jgi:hypothetical protein